MKVLFIGGTGLISSACSQLAVDRGIDLFILNRGRSHKYEAPAGATLLITFRGERACVQINGDNLAVDDADPARKLDRLIAVATRIVLVLADAAGSYLALERQLPEHCIVLAAPASESLVEAYRELKSAEAATGIVPDVFVVEAGGEAEAERAYRRLARVAIAHLGGSPTFAGRRLKRATDGGAWASPQTVMDYVSAELVYERLRPVLETEGNKRQASDLRPQTSGAAEKEETTKTTKEETTTATPSGKRHLITAAANSASALHDSSVRPKMFAAWTPGSEEELLAAVGESLEGLLPQNRGVIELAGLVGAAERPALLAVDAAGRAVAVLAAEEGTGEASANPEVLRAALEARRWLEDHVRLIARAYPEAGLDAAGETAPPVVLVSAARSGDLEILCPAGVELVAWTGVEYGTARGLMFRRVLGVSDVGSEVFAAAPAKHDFEPKFEVSGLNPSPGPYGPPSPKGEGLTEAEEFDDELSAGEMAELRHSLDLDQLT